MAKNATRTSRKQRVSEIQEAVKDMKWLGEIITWASGVDGSVHLHSDVVAALVAANLDPAQARELLPRHAFARAANKMTEDRVIDVFKEDEHEIIFQFTSKALEEKQWTFSREAFVVLNKTTGIIQSDDSDIQKAAQEAIDKATVSRSTADITRIVQRLFDAHSDLIPIRDSGGVYFVPDVHGGFTDRVELFLSALGGHITRVPVPAGTEKGDKAIQTAVATNLEKLINNHMEAVKQFERNTRKDTIARSSEKLKQTRIRIEAYASYLGDKQKELLSKIGEATNLLKEQVENIGGGAKEYSTYDWDVILDGKTHKLMKGEDYSSKSITVVSRARTLAKRRGLKIQSKILDDGVILRALPIE